MEFVFEKVRPRALSPLSQPNMIEKCCEGLNNFFNRFSVASVFTIHFYLIVSFFLIHGDPIQEQMKPYMAFYNGFFFLCLIWATVDPIKPGPLQMATLIDLISIGFDIIVATKFCHSQNLLVVPNALLRPVTSLILLRKSYERKRNLTRQTNEYTSFLSAIKNLLYSQQQQSETTGYSDEHVLYSGSEMIHHSRLSTIPTMTNSLNLHNIRNSLPNHTRI